MGGMSSSLHFCLHEIVVAFVLTVKFIFTISHAGREANLSSTDNKSLARKVIFISA